MFASDAFPRRSRNTRAPSPSAPSQHPPPTRASVGQSNKRTEKAARGTDGRIYPWGDAWEAHGANIAERRERQTSPVGAYPRDVSPYGVYDLAGNVSEWTRTSYTLEWDDSYTGGHHTKERYALKGGSWFQTPRRARAADHSVDAADSYAAMSGLRLVLRALALDQRLTP